MVDEWFVWLGVSIPTYPENTYPTGLLYRFARLPQGLPVRVTEVRGRT